MRPSLLLVLLLLAGCPEGDPCPWTVTNDTTVTLQTVRAALSSSFDWSADALVNDGILPVGESVTFDVPGNGSYDIQGFGPDGRSFTRVNAGTCEGGAAVASTLSAGDRDQ